LGLHTTKEMTGDGFEAYWVGSLREIATKGDLSSYWSRITSDGDFSKMVPSYTSSRDPLRRLCHRLIAVSISVRGQAPEKVTDTDLFYLRSMDKGTAVNVPYLLAQYLFRHAKGRKHGARMLDGHFVGHLAEHFGLVTEEGLQGLTMVVGELRVIDIDELVDEEIPDEGVQVDPIPAQGPPAAAPIVRTMPQKMAKLEEEVHYRDGWSSVTAARCEWGDLSEVELVKSGSLNTAYHGFEIRRIDFLTLLNENDDYGRVFIFWNYVCCSHAGIQTL
ncbi:hypothetical protein Tco_0238040, partial [Tanacetum coccineum]